MLPVKQVKEEVNWQAQRKALRKKAEAQYGRKTEWTGGVLYFSGTTTKVPGCCAVLKPGQSEKGMAANEPKQPKRPKVRRKKFEETNYPRLEYSRYGY